MVLKKVGVWVLVWGVSALVSYLIAHLMRQQALTDARVLHAQTIGDVNDLMNGMKHYAKTNFGWVE